VSVAEDQLIDEVRGLAPLVAGHGMHVQVRGDQLRALLSRIDQLTPVPATNGSGNGADASVPPPPAWQIPLSGVVRVVAEIVEDPGYRDLCGTNLVDALHAWAARNETTLGAAALSAVGRALSGE
jgi:hypothetical protein